MSKRIVLTGGSGKAGRHIIAHLLSHGHQILNLDLVPLPPDVDFAFSQAKLAGSTTQSSKPTPTASSLVHTIRVDLTSPADVFSALTSHFAPTEPLPPGPPPIPDAIIHFAGIPHPLIVPDHDTFRINTLSCYNVIETACKLGIPKIIIASSLTVYGRSYCEGPKQYTSFPVTEDSPIDPTDAYALSKVCCERIAESFARKFVGKADIYALRIGRITTPEEYSGAMFRSYVEEPEKWGVHGWVYTDIRDLAEICHLAVMKEKGEEAGDGYVCMNAVNDEITNFEDSRRFLGRVQPGVEVGDLGEREGPVRNWRCKEVLGWREKWGWRRIWEEAG